MYSEREAFLSDSYNCTNKGNGYRHVRGYGFGKELGLSVPHDRFGVFRPLILAILRDQQ
jgi:hypothetical protein